MDLFWKRIARLTVTSCLWPYWQLYWGLQSIVMQSSLWQRLLCSAPLYCSPAVTVSLQYTKTKSIWFCRAWSVRKRSPVRRLSHIDLYNVCQHHDNVRHWLVQSVNNSVYIAACLTIIWQLLYARLWWRARSLLVSELSMARSDHVQHYRPNYEALSYLHHIELE